MAKESVWAAYFTTSYNPLEAGSIDRTDEVPHDQAINRAFAAKYKPNRCVSGDPHCTLFIGRLNPDTTEKTLIREFSEYGRIQHVRIVRDVVTGFSKRYAFVEFEQKSSAKRAYEFMDTRTIDDHSVLVEYENERLMTGWVPRRLGGGLGGRKESGQLRFGGRERPFKKPFLLRDQPNVGFGRKTLEQNVKREPQSSPNREWYRSKETHSERDRDRDRKRKRSRSRDRGNKHDRSRRARSRDRHRSRSKGRRSRSKGRRSRSRGRRSRSKEKQYRSRDRHSRSRERSSRRREDSKYKGRRSRSKDRHVNVEDQPLKSIDRPSERSDSVCNDPPSGNITESTLSATNS